MPPAILVIDVTPFAPRLSRKLIAAPLFWPEILPEFTIVDPLAPATTIASALALPGEVLPPVEARAVIDPALVSENGPLPGPTERISGPPTPFRRAPARTSMVMFSPARLSCTPVPVGV